MSRVSPFDAIGTEITGEPTHAEDCLESAGLDFHVSLEPVKNSLTGEVIMSEGSPPEPKYFQVVRSDTRAVLGIVEGRFTPIQNIDVFGLADSMVSSGARIIRAAEIEQGARCFMTLEWRSEHAIDVVGDVVGRRAIIQNAHNGKYSAMIRLMPLRLACTNGLVVPIKEAEFEFRIKHTVGGEERLIEAAEVLQRADEYFDRFSRTAEVLARTTVGSSHAEQILWTVPEFKGRQQSGAVKKKVASILSLFEGEQKEGDREAVRGTAWGLLNAAAEFADYSDESRVRVTTGTTPEIQRFKSAFNGTNQRLKVGAYESLLKDRDLGLKEQLASLN